MHVDVGNILVGSGVGGVIVATVRAFLDRRKIGAEVQNVDADTASVLSKAAAQLVADQGDLIVRPLRERIHELEGEVDVLRRKVDAAIVQLATAETERDEARAELARCRAQQTPEPPSRGVHP